MSACVAGLLCPDEYFAPSHFVTHLLLCNNHAVGGRWPANYGPLMVQ